MIATPESASDGWAAPVKRLRAPRTPPGATNLNVDGRKLNGPFQGFGQLWRRTYRIRLSGTTIEPADVVRLWKTHFGEFWPAGNTFYAGLGALSPGDVAVLSLAPMRGPIKLTTGVMVIFSDQTSFTFMPPEGHMYAGWNTFSAYVEDGATWAQVQVLVRTSDPAWEVVMRLFAFKSEDRFWTRTLQHLAAFLGATNTDVDQRVELVDAAVQWSRAANTWRNAAVWSGLYALTAPLRWTRWRLPHRRTGPGVS